MKMPLAGLGGKIEYDRFAARVGKLSDQYEPVSDAIGETAGTIWSALSMAASELEAGYQRVVPKAIGEN